MANPSWSLQIVESGAMGSQLYIVATDRPLTPEQLSEARLTVDQAFLHPQNIEWLSMVCPWVPEGSHRFISGVRSETRALVNRLNKRK